MLLSGPHRRIHLSLLAAPGWAPAGEQPQLSPSSSAPAPESVMRGPRRGARPGRGRWGRALPRGERVAGAVPGGASSHWERLFRPAQGSVGPPRQRDKREGTWGLLLVGQNGISLLNTIKHIGKDKTTPAPLLSVGSTRSSRGEKVMGRSLLSLENDPWKSLC